MTCIDMRKHSRSKPTFVCIDPDDLCRYFGQLVNDGEHQYDSGECIVCGAARGEGEPT